MEQKLDFVINELKEIKLILKNLQIETEEVKKSCHGMDNHIDFIDSVYSNLRHPLDWITRKISGKTLPKPKNNIRINKSLLTNLISS